jgi:HPt (histidine-containing phosphotransfer) domain-containing protein
VDPAGLDDLGQQMGSKDIALNFARDYAEMWVRRQHVLRAAVERQDNHAALDAALSLKNASAMVGGIRLARLAEALERAIRRGEDLNSGGDLLDKVADHGRATVRELQNSYLRNKGPRGLTL